MIATNVIAALLILQALLLGTAKVLQTAPMRERAAHVGFTVENYSRIGVLELLAAFGLAVGIAYPPIGVLAACGLIVLMAGAVATHRRVGDSLRVMAPAVVVALLSIVYVAITLLNR